MKILAFDQATRFTGVSLVEDNQVVYYELINTSKISKLQFKISFIKNRMLQLINEYKPDKIVFEDVQYQSNQKTFKILSKLLGNLEVAALECGYECGVIPVTTWRGILGFPKGNRKESKNNAINYIKNININIKYDDVAEAICIALAVSKGGLNLWKKIQI